MAKAKASRRRSTARRRGSKPKRAVKAAHRARVRAKAARRRAHPTPKPPAKIQDPRVAAALKEYALAMRYFNRQKYRRARQILTTLVNAPSYELAERARMHLAICERRLQRPERPRLRTGDDYYYYGVSLTNLHRYNEARAALAKARKRLPKADYIYYALATLAAHSGDSDEALANLKQSLRLRPENRFQARNDSDFKPLESDPRFHELLYPERTVTA